MRHGYGLGAKPGDERKCLQTRALPLGHLHDT